MRRKSMLRIILLMFVSLSLFLLTGCADSESDKQEKKVQEQWREMTKTDKLKNLKSKPDPF